MKEITQKNFLTKLKEIETLVELSIGKEMTEDRATDIYALTNELMCDIRNVNKPELGQNKLYYSEDEKNIIYNSETDEDICMYFGKKNKELLLKVLNKPLWDIQDLKLKIDSFSTLEKNWNGYGSDVINNITIESAHKLLDKISKIYNNINVFPMSNSGIQFDIGEYKEIEVINKHIREIDFDLNFNVINEKNYEIDERTI